MCETCVPGEAPEPFTPGTCTPVVEYQRWTVKEYGYVAGGADTDAAVGTPYTLSNPADPQRLKAPPGFNPRS